MSDRQRMVVRTCCNAVFLVVFFMVAAGVAFAHDNRVDGTYNGEELQGHAHYDAIFGYQGADRLYGWDDQDHLQGGEDDDELFGGQGADIVLGGKGTDVLWGGKGNDFLTDKSGEPGIAQVFQCGDGFDFFAVPESWVSGTHYLAFGCEVRDVINPDPPPRAR